MKVAHLISGGDSGGAKTHLFSLMKGLEARLDAKIICFMEGPFYEEAKSLGIPIQVMAQKSRFDLSVLDQVTQLINKEGYDLVHCHGARANFNALFIRPKISVPMVTTLHSDYRLDFKDNLIKNLVFTPLNTWALKSFNHYIAVTQNFRDMLVGRGFPRDSIFVTYNGLDFDAQEDYVTKEAFLARYGLEDKAGRVLASVAARLDLVKDHKTLLEAISLAKEDLAGAHLILAGQGPEIDNLRAQVRDEGLGDLVSLIGQVADPYSLFNAVDFNLLTSRSESFPYALLEGAKMKKPFVASRVGGIPEMLGDSGGGLLFEPGNPQDLAQALVTMVGGGSDLPKMGQSLYDHVKENFSAQAMSLAHEEIYKKILKEEGRNYEDN